MNAVKCSCRNTRPAPHRTRNGRCPWKRIFSTLLSALVLVIVGRASPTHAAAAPGEVVWVPIGVRTLTWMPVRRGPALSEGAACRLGVQCETGACRDAICVDPAKGTDCYIDDDGDGFGADAGHFVSYDGACPADSAVVGHDCDDTLPAVYPGAEEQCNGVDDDCDGFAEESFAEVGQPCQVGVGECLSLGTYECTADFDAVQCTASPGVVQPETYNGLDDDCNGIVDDSTVRPPNDCSNTEGDGAVCEVEDGVMCHWVSVGAWSPGKWSLAVEGCRPDPSVLAQIYACSSDLSCPCGSHCVLGLCDYDCLQDGECSAGERCDYLGRCSLGTTAAPPGGE